MYNLQRGREEGPLAGPLLGSVYPRAASAHRRGHPTPREPQDYRGPSAHLPQHSHKTNSGEGATLAFFSGGDAESFSLLQAQALQEQGVAGEARGRQGRRRRSARPERHLSTELTRREGLRGARHTGSRSGGEWGGGGGTTGLELAPPHMVPSPRRACPATPEAAAGTRRATRGPARRLGLPGRRPLAALAHLPLWLVGRGKGGAWHPGRISRRPAGSKGSAGPPVLGTSPRPHSAAGSRPLCILPRLGLGRAGGTAKPTP